MKKIFLVFAFVLGIFLFSSRTFAVGFTKDEVAKHNSSTDCYMIFEDKVYDFSNYLKSHDKYLNIRYWCGKNMTEDFQTKGEMGEDHRSSSYSLLDKYYVGNLVSESSSLPIEKESEVVEENLIVPVVSTSETHSDDDEEYFVEIEGNAMKELTITKIAKLWEIDAEIYLQELIKEFDLKKSYSTDNLLGDLRDEYKFSPALAKDVAERIRKDTLAGDLEKYSEEEILATNNLEKPTLKKDSDSPYPFASLIIFSLGAYLIHHFVAFRTKLGEKRGIFWKGNFDFFWNTLLLISFVPSGIFGLYLSARYQFDFLDKMDFDFLYWHVVGSTIMATLIIMHIIKRLWHYKSGLKRIFGK